MKLAHKNIIFMGTSSFAVPILESLAKNFKVKVVVSQPDRKVGRKQTLSPPPVKEAALALNLSVYQAENLKQPESLKYLKSLDSDFIVVAAYGQILPKKILALPKQACLNVHASLLPKYRGASPIQTALLHGDLETGVSIMLMDEGLDTGPVLKQARLKIEKTDDYLSLERKLAGLGAETLLEVLRSAELKASPQNEKGVSLTKILRKEDGLLDFENKTAAELERQIRAFSLWPQTYTIWKNKRLKILAAEFAESSKHEAAEVYLEEGLLKIACRKGTLIAKTLQLEGKTPVAAAEFLRGYPNFAGEKLSST